MDKIIDYKRILVTDIPLLVTSPSGGVGRYSARVYDIDENCFDISYPTAGGAFISVSKNAELHITITDRGYYHFNSKVIEYTGKKLPLLKMTLPVYIEKCERREFFRLEVMQKVKIYGASISLKCNEVDVFPDTLIGECVCAEIGGGGARLICEKKLPEGTLIGLDLSPVIKNFQMVKCLVVRADLRPDKMVDIGVKFVQMRNAERDAIVKSCYNKQIERRDMMPCIKR